MYDGRLESVSLFKVTLDFTEKNREKDTVVQIIVALKSSYFTFENSIQLILFS